MFYAFELVHVPTTFTTYQSEPLLHKVTDGWKVPASSVVFR
jgi:hypothetical protein